MSCTNAKNEKNKFIAIHLLDYDFDYSYYTSKCGKIQCNVLKIHK